MPPLYIPLRHKICKEQVETAVLKNDVAIYVWCPKCHDIVETGELEQWSNNQWERVIDDDGFVIVRSY